MSLSPIFLLHDSPRAGDRVIDRRQPHFPARRVAAVDERNYVRLADGSARPGGALLVVPADWQDAPVRPVSAMAALEAATSGPIAETAYAAAALRDRALPALVDRLDYDEAYLAWVRRHLLPLDPAGFEPQLRAAELSRELSLRTWTAAAEAVPVLAAA